MSAPRRAGVWVLLFLSIIAAALLSGCNTGVAERSAEGRLRRRLPEIIGPAESYKVNIRAASDLSVMKGRLRSIAIEGKRVRIANRWPIDRLLVTLDKVRVDVEKETLQEVGAAAFQATIRPATLVRYLEDDQENLRDVNILLDQGVLTITGDYLMVGLWTPFRVSGTLELPDPSRIGFKASGARAAGIPVPSPVIRYLERRLNPVLDVSDVLLPVELTAVLIRPDGVVVTGVPDLSDVSLLNRL